MDFGIPGRFWEGYAILTSWVTECSSDILSLIGGVGWGGGGVSPAVSSSVVKVGPLVYTAVHS